MGIQFYHFETYGRTESKSKTKCKEGKSIYSIAGEAERTLGYCDHVEEPQEPVLLFGVSFSEVIKLSENYTANTFDSQGRAVRKNGLCMIAGVVSAPPDMTEKVWKVFKKASLEYLQKTWGDNLKSVIEHTDEYFEPDPEHGIKPETLHRHLHFACVPPVGVNFAEIHPGIKAKRAADKAYGVTKKPDGLDDDGFRIFKKEGRQAGDRAYRQAMRLVQDDFFNNVSDKFGLLRYGPKRLRLTRDEIIKRNHERRLKQKLAVALAEQEKEAKKLAVEIKKTQYDLEKTLSEKQKLEDELKDWKKAVSDSEKTIKERETVVAFAEREKVAFEKGLKTSLRGWQLPKPNIGEFAGHYIKRVAGEVMGIVQRALNIIKDYNRKKAELENEKAIFEAETRERQKQDDAKIASLQKSHSKEVQGWKAAYGRLKSRILGVKTLQEFAVLQGELSSSQSRSGR